MGIDWRTPRSARDRHWCGRRTGSPTSTTTGTAPCGVTGSRAWPDHRTLVRYDERGLRAARTTTSRSGPSTPSSTIWSGSWMPSTSTLPAAGTVAGRSGGHDLRGPTPGAGEPPGPGRHLCPGQVPASTDGRGSERGPPADRDGPPGLGARRPTFRRFFTSAFIPDAPRKLWDMFAELIRRTTSAENAAHRSRRGRTWMSSEVAGRLDVPTLILHARGDLRVPFDQALEAWDPDQRQPGGPPRQRQPPPACRRTSLGAAAGGDRRLPARGA